MNTHPDIFTAEKATIKKHGLAVTPMLQDILETAVRKAAQMASTHPLHASTISPQNAASTAPMAGFKHMP